MNTTESILQKCSFSKGEIISLLSLQNRDEQIPLFRAGKLARNKYVGAKVHLRGIIEFSNYCTQDCIYCGIRKSNLSLERYRMSFEEILSTAKLIYNSEIKTVVLQSGEDPYYDCDFISKLIVKIKEEFNLAITLSLGEREYYEYEKWKSAGADRYLLKHETANPEIYSQIHNSGSLSERLEHLSYLDSLGFQIGSGNIIGLPGQTIEDIADDLILCSKYQLDMASFSPFIPSSDTPFSDVPKASLDLTLKTLAVARLILKYAHIPATTALATLDELGREKGINVGANVVMPSFTPVGVKTKYSIYDNKRCITEDASSCMPCLRARIESCGVEIDNGYGHSLYLNQ